MLSKKLLRVLTIAPLTLGLIAQAMPATNVLAAPVTQNVESNSSSTGKWITGEFHAHTFESDDAQSSLENVLENAFTKYGLDWIATANHLRSSKRDDNGADVPGGPIPFSQGAINYEVPKVKALQAAGNYSDKTIFSGFEWDIPKHDHGAIGILSDTPGSVEALKAANQFEYLFTNRPENMFDANDVATWNLTDSRITNFDHADSLTGIKWLQKNFADKSYFLVTHPSRGVGKTTIADLRDFNDAAPNINFGFEGMLGNQMEPDRGGYNTTYNIANPTADDNYKYRSFGGSDYMITKVGGVWDALLGEGRNYWNFANSDFHFKILGSNSSGYWPGEYAKNYTWTNGNDMQSVVNGMRSGKSFSVYGDLINALDFNIEGNDGKLEMGAANPQITVTEGDHLQLTIRFKSPAKNNYEVPVLNGVPANIAPKVDHVDLIAGDVSDEKAVAGTSAYNKDTNDSTSVIATFTSEDWTTDQDGYNVISYDLGAAKKKQYFRLRGTNLGLNVPGETDAEGNPLLDPKTNDSDDTTRFNNINDRNYKDLWFYSNPIFVKPTPYSDDQAINDTVDKRSIANSSEVSSDLELSYTGEHGITIKWESSIPSIISNDGKLLSRPANNTMLNLIATIKRGDATTTKTFPVIVKGINSAVIELHGTMTTADGQPYSSGTWTNQNVTVSVYANVFTPSTSASIALSTDGEMTYNPYESNSKIEVSQDGTHDFFFKGTDNFNNQLVLQLMAKIDKVAPVITLIGDKSISITRGSTYNELGATATDNVALSGKVAITGTVDTNTAGTYLLHYNVNDSVGNTAIEVIRTVTVYVESKGGGSTPTPATPTPTPTPVATPVATPNATPVATAVPTATPMPIPFYNEKVNLDVVKAIVEKADLAQTVTFKDVPKDAPNAKAIILATKLGIIKGFADGSFHADANVTRAEFATMLVNALGLKATGNASFTDSKGNWAESSINALKSSGIINGYLDGSFKPNQSISREEIVSMLSKVLNTTSIPKPSKFSDISTSWASSAINTLTDIGIVNGASNESFKPKANATRSESLMMILRMLNISLGLSLEIE
ncbi:S-layer homology domain-containing protein [Paenibacillus psychroresistens]|nr:S-layer homology domain-containing protein [Paenibacillus psychroresistens]